MRTLILATTIALSTSFAHAQTQQAGADSSQAEEAFQALIEKCDNVNLLAKRAKVRLIIVRIDEEKAAVAQGKIDEAFAKCGGGDMASAETLLDEAFTIADAASTETFGTDSSTETDEAEEETAEASESSDEKAKKPWWKLW